MQVGTVTDGGGWSGISHSAGMPNSLLLMVWPNAGKILTSFRYARFVNDFIDKDESTD